MLNIIDSFKDEYRFLSNFYPCEVELDGVVYPSAENAYQAAKTLNAAERVVFVTATAGGAKRLGRSLTLRPDWDRVKAEVMLKLLLQKFKPNSELGLCLDETDNKYLIEGNNWGDTYWGMCKGEGLNILGKLLMAVRKRNRALMPPRKPKYEKTYAQYVGEKAEREARWKAHHARSERGKDQYAKLVNKQTCSWVLKCKGSDEYLAGTYMRIPDWEDGDGPQGDYYTKDIKKAKRFVLKHHAEAKMRSYFNSPFEIVEIPLVW